MDQYLLLRFAHLIGLMLMSGGLIGVFVADMRSRQVRDLKLFTQVVTLIAVFYDGLVVLGGAINSDEPADILMLLVTGGIDKHPAPSPRGGGDYQATVFADRLGARRILCAPQPRA
jgi:hypothetical protein